MRRSDHGNRRFPAQIGGGKLNRSRQDRIEEIGLLAFRCIISEALGLATPVIIGVPRRNLASWRAFAGDFAIEREISAGL
jgi:hypothetical protein